MAQTFRVEVHREGRWWMLHVPALDGVNGLGECLGQSRRYADIPADARDIVGVVADVAPSEIDLDIHVKVGDLDLADIAARIAAERSIAEEAHARAHTESLIIAKRLADDGIPVRDIAAVIGVSYQRAHQLAS